MKLTVAENFRGIFYIPFYVLRERSLAQQLGLDVTWLPPGSPGGAIDDVKSGTIDLTWGGPMRVMIDHDTTEDNDNRLISVSGAVGKDPFSLIAKQPNIRLTDLPDLRVSVVKEVPTPWICLQADLQDRGISIPRQLISNLTMQEQIDALSRGEVDVIQAFEPLVSQALSNGGAHLLYEACERGPTVYTGFITSRATLKAKHDALEALDTALAQALLWMRQAGAEETAKLIGAYFPELSQENLTSAARRYLSREVWSSVTQINRAGFERLSDSFFRAGAIRAPANYDRCVFNFGDQ